MKQYLKVASILFLICAVAAIFLALVNSVTAPRIVLNEKRNTELALEKISGGFSLGERREGKESIKYSIDLLDRENKIGGYIVELSASGYGGAFSLLASYDLKGVLLDAKMLTNSETPGLGKKAEEAWYMDFFKGKGDTAAIPLKKSDLDSASASLISGASVTFSAVSKALNLGSLYVKNLGGK